MYPFSRVSISSFRAVLNSFRLLSAVGCVLNSKQHNSAGNFFRRIGISKLPATKFQKLRLVTLILGCYSHNYRKILLNASCLDLVGVFWRVHPYAR